MRPSTIIIDVQILEMYYTSAIPPKEIAYQLHLPNVWRVYDALKRERRLMRDRRAAPRDSTDRRQTHEEAQV